jgi:hypothetical protein
MPANYFIFIISQLYYLFVYTFFIAFYHNILYMIKKYMISNNNSKLGYYIIIHNTIMHAHAWILNIIYFGE